MSANEWLLVGPETMASWDAPTRSFVGLVLRRIQEGWQVAGYSGVAATRDEAEERVVWARAGGGYTQAQLEGGRP